MKEARGGLRSLAISADAAGCSSVRKRAGMAKKTTRRGSVGSRGGSRELATEKDPVGQVRERGGGLLRLRKVLVCPWRAHTCRSMQGRKKCADED